MPKFRTVKFSFDGAVKNELNFSTVVHVNTKGLFTTTLPTGVVVFLSANGVKTGFSKGGEKGFFSAKTFDELVEQINATCRDCMAPELIESKIVIRYSYQTTCTYSITNSGEIVPKMTYKNVSALHEGITGNKESDSVFPEPYGVQLFAKPYRKKIYRFVTGLEKVEYVNLDNQDREEGKNLKFLDDFKNGRFPGSKVKEIDYTEKVAWFFSDMLISVCSLNERLKNFLEKDPESKPKMKVA